MALWSATLLLACVYLGTAAPPSATIQFVNRDGVNTTATEIFRADFSKPNIRQAFNVNNVAWGESNAILWASGGGIDVVYPAGSYSPDGPIKGGFGLENTYRVHNTAILRYSVFFPAGFNFHWGGKIPGLYGGYPCGGGNPANDCFSTRLMWRENGKGELYFYAKRDEQDQSICNRPGNYCGAEFGWSLNTGSWTFQTGVWTELEQTLTLNTPGVQNGYLSIKVNGVEKIRYDNLVFRGRNYPNIIMEGLMVQTFFGGGSPPWATPNRQVTKFKDFVLYAA